MLTATVDPTMADANSDVQEPPTLTQTLNHCIPVQTIRAPVPPHPEDNLLQHQHQGYPQFDSSSHLTGSGIDPFTQIDSPTTSMPSVNDIFSPSCLQRPASPAPTADFSILDVDVETLPSAQYQGCTHGDDSSYDCPVYSVTRRARHSRSASPAIPFNSKRGFHSSPSLSLNITDHDDAQATYPGDLATLIEGQYDFLDSSSSLSPSSIKALFPRIWEVLSSPGKSLFPNVITPSSSPPSFASPSPFTPSARQQFTGSGTFPRWKGKGKAKAHTSGIDWGSEEIDDPFIDFSELAPLDDEEGELIDDEACFVEVRAVTGVDILSLLPTELALHILILLCAPVSLRSKSGPSSTDLESYPYPIPDSDAFRSILACLAVSRKWRALASDNSVWQALFMGRWAIDLRRANGLLKLTRQRCIQSARIEFTPSQLGRINTFEPRSWTPTIKKSAGESSPSQLLSMSWPMVQRVTPHLISPRNAPLQLDWRRLYQERYELEGRWSGHARPIKPVFLDVYNRPSYASLGARNKWEPKMARMAGHTDSVYCLEFDSQRIITGSRDRTIKVWSLRTGRLLATFRGVHNGSVLCLKFEHDWDQGWDDIQAEGDEDSAPEHQDIRRGMSCQPGSSNISFQEQFPKSFNKAKMGFMVSGSSDHSICVWDIWTGRPLLDDNLVESGDKEVNAEPRAILRGHIGGVLDLKIDRKWIVSCSKDAVVRVWNRNTLEPYRIFRGHDGPVNAVGLQDGRVVSASGDGKMILWDIQSGERLRTFEGHDRGLACIEFKGDLIVSGSNDCKIKIWSASTGECLRTLIGHDALVRALSFDPHNGRLVSASYDKTVKLWDIKTGKLINTFVGRHSSHIFDVKLDVSRIVSTSHDRHIVVLDFSQGLDASLFV